jgi:hypothetical protein
MPTVWLTRNIYEISVHSEDWKTFIAALAQSNRIIVTKTGVEKYVAHYTTNVKIILIAKAYAFSTYYYEQPQAVARPRGFGGFEPPTCLQDNSWGSYKTAEKIILGG